MTKREFSNHSEETLRTRLWQIATIPVDDYLPFGHIPGIVKPGYRHILKSCDLPQELKLFILSVVRKTRLWQYEKRDVARELIAHFEDGISAGKNTTALMQSFGDVKITSNLIRRSKKRTRPLVWHAWRRSWQAAGIAFVLLILIYVFSAARMFLSSPSPSHDYLADMNTIPASIPEKDRAWPLYRTALIAIKPDLKLTGTSLGAKPGDEEWHIIAKFIDNHQESIKLLRQAASRRGLGYELSHEYHEEDLPLFELDKNAAQVYEGPLLIMGVFMPHLKYVIDATRILNSDAFRAAERGDGATVIADLEAMIQTAGLARDIPFIINDLVSNSILDRAIKTTQKLLHDKPELFTEDDLIRITHRFATFAGGGTIHITMQGEQASFMDLVQHMYSDNGKGNGYLTADGAKLFELLRPIKTTGLTDEQILINVMTTVGMPAFGILTADRKDMVDTYNSLASQAAAESRIPLWQRESSKCEKRFTEMHNSVIDSIKYWPILKLLPGLPQFYSGGEQLTQRRDGLLVAIAIELHKRRTGSWPQTLDELSPILLPSIPRDRFDGGPIKYALRDGQPVIYSIGTDLDDDGGREIDTQADPNSKGWDAQRWIPHDEVEAIKKVQSNGLRSKYYIPDADWILWPPQRDN